MTCEAADLSKADSKAGRLQRACLEIHREHNRHPDGLPTSCFIFYELVQSGVISKKTEGGGRRADQDVAVALFHLRSIGLIPWEDIVDETRSLSKWPYYRTIAEGLDDKISFARIDVWDGEPPPLILTESRSLAGVLDNLAYTYLCPIAATNGQVGGFLRTDIAPALSIGQRVLYLGDWDLQGTQIETNTRSVLEDLVGGELAWDRLALTEEQVTRRRLVRIRKADRRYSPVRYHDAVETEALKQNVIVDIVRKRLTTLLPEPLDDVRREQAQRDQVRAALAKLARRR